MDQRRASECDSGGDRGAGVDGGIRVASAARRRVSPKLATASRRNAATRAAASGHTGRPRRRAVRHVSHPRRGPPGDRTVVALDHTQLGRGGRQSARLVRNRLSSRGSSLAEWATRGGPAFYRDRRRRAGKHDRFHRAAAEQWRLARLPHTLGRVLYRGMAFANSHARRQPVDYRLGRVRSGQRVVGVAGARLRCRCRVVGRRGIQHGGIVVGRRRHCWPSARGTSWRRGETAAAA